MSFQKTKSQYFCKSCGYCSSKWLGKCPACQAWNSFEEESSVSTSSPVKLEHPLVWEKLILEEGHDPRQSLKRFSTGLTELDRVLGGGLISDSLTLLGGDPGIGKSTLLLQMASGLVQNYPDIQIYYASGEESTAQIRNRADRLGISGKENIFLIAETRLENVLNTIVELKPQILFMDSLQTFCASRSSTMTATPGSLSQLREITIQLMTFAKTFQVAVWLVGHVTKEGNIAGPKSVEHMVDTVLYFEGEGGCQYRLLRTVKNRFGSTGELGVFEMGAHGLSPVANPSSLFLTARTQAVAGTSVTAALEGSRPFLVELQALVVHSGLALPRRTAVGMDSGRISLLAAILEKHLKLSLANYDLFFNVSGGLKLSEPGCDLAAAVAIWSSAVHQAIPVDWVFLGELGLTGEVRTISQLPIRLLEAQRLGFKTCVLPKTAIKNTLMEEKIKEFKMKIIYMNRIEELKSLLSS